ncbi:WD40 repeat-like protein [Xylaria nigripes]|nr:WD40 repeat-like protein [Xylaria nigripes]
MSPNLPMMMMSAQDGDNHVGHRPSPPSQDILTRSNAAYATAESSPSGLDGPSYPLPRSTASSSGDLSTNISRRLASTPVKNDRPKGRKDAVSKEITKEPGNSRDSIKDVRDQRTNGRTASPAQPPTAIDPLSHYILTKTNTEHSNALRRLNSTRPESPANESLTRLSADNNRRSALYPEPARDKRKGVSLLSRLSMLGGRKKNSDILDDESEQSDHRTEGANAVAFSSAVYIPHHKEPPRYIRVRTQHKRTKEFNRIFLAQELVGTRPSPSVAEDVSLDGDSPSESHTKTSRTSGGPIWAVGFSQDGRYLATGGRDRVLRVWAVIATEEDRKVYDDESAKTDNEERLSAPAFHSKPAREFTGHEGDILDLSWSKNNFLLSSSMDKTVRLWHMSRQECLCTFKHKDFVASIAFHPRDDRFFLAGSLDSSLRLWSIPDKAVAYSAQLSDILTAVGFSPDGKTAIAGCFHGLCVFFETEGLKYQSQIHVRSSRGKNAKGSKITGLQTVNFSPDNADNEVKLLVTSNDSRIRIYNLADRTLEAKLKGHENACSQIRATFSDDGAYIICGSEDRKAFIWSKDTAQSEGREKRAYEHFEAHSDLVTAAIFAPTKTRQLLQASQDPIFTLCNPPPITLRSREEMTASQMSTNDAQSEHSVKAKKPEESPAFVARSAHHDGNIIVTTDNSGLIKVFRQDCAFAKRRHDTWETGSSFSRKLGRDKLLKRTGSIVTGTSVSSRDQNSRRGSLSTPLHLTSDRIDSWRRGVEGNPGRPLSFPVMATPPTTSASAHVDRSPSPIKAGPPHSPLSPTLPTKASPASPAFPPISPAASVPSSKVSEPPPQGEIPNPPNPSFSIQFVVDDINEPSNSVGASNSFWNLNKWRSMGLTRGTAHDSTMRPSPLSKQMRARSSPRQPDDLISTMDGYTSAGARITEQVRQKGSTDRRRYNGMNHLWPSPLEERDENEDFLTPPERVLTNHTESTHSKLSLELTASEDGEEGEEMECVKCGNHDFRAKRVGGQQRLLCGNCGRMVDV